MKKTFESYRKQLEENLHILPDKPEESLDNTLRSLWLAASGIFVSVEKANDYELSELNQAQIHELDNLIKKRMEGVPLAHLTGKQTFMGVEFNCGPEALIPRKETELLVTHAVELLNGMDKQLLNVIDVCTGAGNIALSIACKSNHCRVYAADISEEAIALSKRNARCLELESRVNFFSGDLLAPFQHLDLHERVDLLTCNPPYISSAKVTELPDEISSFEPKEAFDGGPFGVNLIRRLIVDAEKFLAPGGYFVFEVGLGQGDVIKKLVEKSGLYANIYPVQDERAQTRVIVAQKPM